VHVKSHIDFLLAINVHSELLLQLLNGSLAKIIGLYIGIQHSDFLEVGTRIEIHNNGLLGKGKILSFYLDVSRIIGNFNFSIVPVGSLGVNISSNYYYYYNHFIALWTLSGKTRVSQYQKVHFAIFWIIWCKMKITQAVVGLPPQTNWYPHLYHPHHFYARSPS